MLQGRRPLPTIPASDLARARDWYADKLGLTAYQDAPEALLYQTDGDRLLLLFSSSGAEPPSTSWPPGSWRTLRPRWLSCAAMAWCSRSTTLRSFTR